MLERHAAECALRQRGVGARPRREMRQTPSRRLITVARRNHARLPIAQRARRGGILTLGYKLINACLEAMAIRGFSGGGRRGASELVVIVRAKELCGYVLTATDKLPKKLRFAMVSRLQNYALDAVERPCGAERPIAEVDEVLLVRDVLAWDIWWQTRAEALG